MNATLSHIGNAVRTQKGRWVAILLGFIILYYLSLLATMLIRFGEVPNYITFYNWPGNLWTIFASTPSLTDAINIAREEWLIEIGYINYDFGKGIAEWSLTVLPTKLALQLLAGALVSTFAVLLFSGAAKTCSGATRRSALAATGSGAFLVSLANTTLSWVVCCATPNWVVTLSLLGMSPALALWLEPLGDVMILAGYTLLLGATLVIAHRRAKAVGGAGQSAARLSGTAFSKG